MSELNPVGARVDGAIDDALNIRLNVIESLIKHLQDQISLLQDKVSNLESATGVDYYDG